MGLRAALGVLFLAALLEAGGDALVRAGLGASGLGRRLALLLAGGLTLFAYGCASLNVFFSDVPRCPDVPNDTLSAGSSGFGLCV